MVKNSINNIKPGVKCHEIDKIVRNFVDSTKYTNCFRHSTGHGIGLEIHEKPFLSKYSKETLEPGMVITIEPGIYIKGDFGIRIEDMILVTETGFENLTNATKDITTL